MKRIFVLAAACLLVSGATVLGAAGPLQQGSVLLGGQAYFSSYSGDLYKQDGRNVTQIMAVPTVGMIVEDGLMFGGQVGYSHTNVPASTTDLLIGPTIRYFLGHVERVHKGKFAAYVSAAALIHSITDKSREYRPTHRGMLLAWEVGAVYFMTDRVGLDFGVRVQHDRIEEVSGDQAVAGIGIVTTLW
jgi:hypothetical protein